MFTQGLHEAFAGLHRQEPARIQAVLQPVTNGIGMAAAPEDQHRAQLGQMPAQTLMLPVRHAAQFAHLAQHHHERPLLGAFRRGVKHAGHGKRVGVVRIVHDVPAAPAAAGKTLRRQLRVGKTGGDLLGAQAQHVGGGRHGDAVLGAVIAAERRRHVAGTAVQPQAVLPVHAIAAPGIGRTIGKRAAAGREEDHVAEHGPCLADKVIIVGAHEGLPFRGQMRQQAGLVPGHATFAQALGMGGAHIEDQGQIRLEDGAQLVHVALVADTGLEDPEVLVPVGLEHAQGHAHLVVEVAKA